MVDRLSSAAARYLPGSEVRCASTRCTAASLRLADSCRQVPGRTVDGSLAPRLLLQQPCALTSAVLLVDDWDLTLIGFGFDQVEGLGSTFAASRCPIIFVIKTCDPAMGRSAPEVPVIRHDL